MQLRPYQLEAIDALIAYWQAEAGNALIDLPTGTGKSVVIAEIVKMVMDQPDAKIAVVTHVRELVQQNHAEFVGMFPKYAAETGINSAGLKRRDFDKRVTFCSIQSIYKSAHKFGALDIVIVDEAHLMPRNDQTMYQSFMRHALQCNPFCKLVGLTATPYRLDSGSLVEGDGKLFDKIIYSYNVGTAIEHGYLSPVTTKATKTHFDLKNVSVRGGEFVAGELERAVDKEEVNKAAVEEILLHGADRKSWIVFCAGVSHAHHIANLIRDAGYTVGIILGDTPSDERTRLVADFKAGKIRCLCGVSVLTTGFNAPSVDLIAMLRPTQSAGLYVQIVGRGTRLAAGKANCLVLDFAQNIERHGPVDAVRIKTKTSKGGGEAPVRCCPKCDTYVHASVRLCPDCGHEFPKPEPRIVTTFSRAAILSKDIAVKPVKRTIGATPEWLGVTGMTLARHQKAGSPDSLLVNYFCGIEAVKAWMCFEHTGFARQKAAQWWIKLSGGKFPPSTVTEALERQHELARNIEINVRQNGKYLEVLAARPVSGVREGGESLRVFAEAG